MSHDRFCAVLALAALSTLLDGCSEGGGATKKPQAPSIPVIIATAADRTVPLTIRAVGTVDPVASVTVVSRVDGPIVKVFVRDGQDVKAGQPLIQIDPEPLQIQVRMAQAKLAGAAAQLEDARAKEIRGRALLDQHYLSSDEYLQLKSSMESAAATVKADGATLDQAKLQLSYSAVRAPVDGKLGHVALRVGNMVHASAAETLTTLNGLDRVDVSFSVPEQNLAAVREALSALTAKVAVPLSTGGELNGDLAFVDNTVDKTSGTIGLRATFDNRARALWPGQFVTVTLSLGIAQIATVVPSVAVAQGPEGAYVYVIASDMTAEQRHVEVKRTSGDVAVISGVRSGERVVVDGQSRLVPGSRVSLRGATAGAHPDPNRA